MDLKEFSTMGSCCSRMIFNEDFALGYKKFAHINFSVEGGSLISLMSKPVDFDRNLLTAEKPFDNTCVENDFSKKYLDFLKTADIDYILMDTYFDITNLLLLKNGSYVSNTGRLQRTDLYGALEIDKQIDVFDNLNEFIALWKNACDSFFDFIKKNCTETKIILNCSRMAYKYKDSNGDFVIKESFMKSAVERNHIRDLLETYLLNNYDVEVLSFDKNTILDKDHSYGLDPSHYTSDYYPTKLTQLIEIIERNENHPYEHEINKKLRKSRRDEEILKFQNWELADYVDIDSHNMNFCPVCGKIGIFEAFEENFGKDTKCPNCESLERHRLSYLLLQNNYYELISQKQVKLLDLMPGTALYNYFSTLSNIDYCPVCENIDDYVSRGMNLVENINFEYFPWEEDTFDVIYNSHVLQYVLNDFNVMDEMYRVLKPDGVCILTVPYSNEANTVEKDMNSFDLTENVGKVPLRTYGLDFKERLKSCGFNVEELKSTDIVKSDFELDYYKLNSSGSIFICTK